MLFAFKNGKVQDVRKGTAPSAWASYLVNGDGSGLTPEDKAQADVFRDWLGGSIVNCEDAGFMWKHDARRFGVKSADCQTYEAI